MQKVQRQRAIRIDVPQMQWAGSLHRHVQEVFRVGMAPFHAYLMQKGELIMDFGTFIGMLVALWIAGAIFNVAYRSGKREGSRKAYGVGFNHGRRHRSQQGCGFFVLVFGIMMALASIAFAAIYWNC